MKVELIKKNCIQCDKSMFLLPCRVRQGIKFCSKNCSNLGQKHSTFWLGKKREYKPRCESFRKGKKHEAIAGSKHWNWKGGITPVNLTIRTSREYKNWREKVYARDNYSCVECGYKGNKLEADHIKPFSLYPELRLNVSNGRTLCKPCHLLTPTFGGRTQI